MDEEKKEQEVPSEPTETTGTEPQVEVGETTGTDSVPESK
jgi:hypothetical protein